MADGVSTGSRSGSANAGRRRTMWPTVLAGAVGAGLAAYAGHHHWIKVAHVDPFAPAQQTGLDSPATTALALVALAAWGVVLVTRGPVRRGVAVLGAAAALAPIPASWVTLHHLEHAHAGSHGTAWPWLALVGLVVSLIASVITVRNAPHWPEMGSKYDAPTADAPVQAAGQPLEEQSSLDLWKSLDEGHDPTQEPTRGQETPED